MTPARVLAIAFWLWSIFVAGAGVVGAAVHCDSGGCELGSAPWFEPWRWDDYAVLPELAVLAAFAVAATTVMLVCVYVGRRVEAAISFAVGLVLLSYPYFVSFPYNSEVLDWLWLGLLLGLAALGTMRGSETETR